MEDEKLRCYLTARFRLEDGRERYVLEVDTSDNKKKMSTRIVEFKRGVEINDLMERIVRGVVRRSLSWPENMSNQCEILRSVYHPKDSVGDECKGGMSSWKNRIKVCLL